MLALYHAARVLGLKPALLESLGPRTPFSRLSLLGLRPRHRLEVLEGRLYLDGRRVGEALEVFSYLEKGLGRGFFPAWIGFFAYEFARHLGLPTHKPLPGLPEAAFHYYPEGFTLLSGRLVERPSMPLRPRPHPLPPMPAHPLVSDFPREAFLKGVEEVHPSWAFWRGRGGPWSREARRGSSKKWAGGSSPGPSPAPGQGGEPRRRTSSWRRSSFPPPRSGPNTPCWWTWCATTSPGWPFPAPCGCGSFSPWSGTPT